MPTNIPINDESEKTVFRGHLLLTRQLKFFLAVHVVGLILLVIGPIHWTWVIACLLLYHLGLGVLGLVPKSRWLGPNITRLPGGDIHRHEVTLTFDDGPDPFTTPKVLDVLDRYGAKASFFCIGERVMAHPDIVRSIVERGHSVENHSYRHSYAFALYGPWRQRREIELAQQAIEKTIGRSPRFFRAPVGFRNVLLYPVLKGLGLEYVSWTSRGFDTLSGKPEKVLARLTDCLAGGDILLLHDAGSAKTGSGEPVVLRALPDLLDLLSEKGLKAVSLPMAFEARTAQSPS